MRPWGSRCKPRSERRRRPGPKLFSPRDKWAKCAETQSQRLDGGYGVLKSQPIAAVSARFRNSRQFAGLFGGPGRTRTCNQTVMSGRISIGFIDFAVFSFDFDRVCFAFVQVFLVRNWRGDFVHLRERPRRACAD